MLSELFSEIAGGAGKAYRDTDLLGRQPITGRFGEFGQLSSPPNNATRA